MAIAFSWMMLSNQFAHADPEEGNVYYVDSWAIFDISDYLLDHLDDEAVSFAFVHPLSWPMSMNNP